MHPNIGEIENERNTVDVDHIEDSSDDVLQSLKDRSILKIKIETDENESPSKRPKMTGCMKSEINDSEKARDNSLSDVFDKSFAKSIHGGYHDGEDIDFSKNLVSVVNCVSKSIDDDNKQSKQAHSIRILHLVTSVYVLFSAPIYPNGLRGSLARRWSVVRYPSRVENFSDVSV